VASFSLACFVERLVALVVGIYRRGWPHLRAFVELLDFFLAVVVAALRDAVFFLGDRFTAAFFFGDALAMSLAVEATIAPRELPMVSATEVATSFFLRVFRVDCAMFDFS
jgi:hypothetical protein